MDAPLWTERHQPTIDDLPQASVRDVLWRAVDEPINLIVHGPPGSGKTAATRALAREAHADPESDLVVVNVADVFDRTKREIADDPRFKPFLGALDQPLSRTSKADLINQVLREAASYPPVSGSYKTVLLDNAEGIREDFQQALRRVMERHHEATQFVIATRQPTKLIAPIRSRCFLVPVPSPTVAQIATVLERIVDAEDVAYDDDGLEYVAGYAAGNLRRAILAAQTTHASAGEVTMTAAYEALGEVGIDDRVEGMLAAAEAGDYSDARSTLLDLLIDDGLTGDEVLRAILRAGRSRYAGERLAALHRLAGEVDADLAEGANERIPLSRLLAELGRDPQLSDLRA